MRIIDIRETAVALKSTLRNAVFDFSEMTTSVVAVITDVTREGKPVVGYAFNSTGRYVSGGWYEPGKGIPQLLDEIRQKLDQGYEVMKIKVGGASIADDVARVDASLKLMRSSQHLAVDANAGFDRERALAYAKALAPFKLKWFEEPTDPLGYELLAEFIAQYGAAVGTGENLFSMQDVENLVTFGGLRAGVDFIQTDVPQSYGIVQFSRTLDMLARRGWPRQSVFPHGGNQMTLHLVGGFGLGGCEAYPGVFGIFAGFADDAKVDDGYLQLPQRPGIGFEAQNPLYAVMKGLTQ
jgi:L-alanine-DL-glutamate epimerase-like enolase superfamily enzyme